MPDQRIEQLGAIGLNSDIAPNLLPPNALTTARNVVMRDGSVASAPGERLVFPAGAYFDVEPLYHIAWRDNATNAQWVVISDGVDVWAYNINQGDGVGEKITPTDDDLPTGNPVTWNNGFVSFAILNGLLVVNSRSNGLFYWGAPGQVLKAASGWNANWRCYQIEAYRYQLVALGMIENAVEYPHKIRWSNSAQEGALPTQWDILLTNDAGDDILGETEGKIVGGVNVRDQLFIIKEDSVFGLRYIGGQYINAATRLEGGVGTRNPKGFCEMRGSLVVLTTADVLVFDGQNSRSLIDQKARVALFSDLSEENWDNCQVWFNSFTHQLYLSYPMLDTGRYVRSAVVFNLEEKTFTSYDLRNSYGFDLGLVSATAETIPTWDDLSGPFQSGTISPHWIEDGSWDAQQDGSWNKGVSQPSLPDTLVYESSDDGTQWWLAVRNFSDSNSDGTPKRCMIGRRGLPVEGAKGVVQLNWCWPEISGRIEDSDNNELPLKMRFGAQQTLNGQITWDPLIYDVYPDRTQTLDPRVSGRYLCWELTSEGLGSWTMAALTFGWESAGEH